MINIIIYPIIQAILLVILIVLIHKKKTSAHVLRYLVPAYLLIIVANIILNFESFISSAPFSPAIYFAIIILLAVCASAGAFLHNKKTYIFGFIAVFTLALFCFWNKLAGFRMSYALCMFLIYLIFLLILCVLGFVYDKSVRSKSLEGLNTKSHRKPVISKSASTQTPASHSILCLAGIFAGAEFSLNGAESITFGSSPLHSQIVLYGATIKEAHCKVWFDQNTAAWCIIDYSDGATYLNETQPLKKDQLYQMKQGATLSLGQAPDKQQFKLL